MRRISGARAPNLRGGREGRIELAPEARATKKQTGGHPVVHHRGSPPRAASPAAPVPLQELPSGRPRWFAPGARVAPGQPPSRASSRERRGTEIGPDEPRTAGSAAVAPASSIRQPRNQNGESRRAYSTPQPGSAGSSGRAGETRRHCGRARPTRAKEAGPLPQHFCSSRGLSPRRLQGSPGRIAGWPLARTGLTPPSNTTRRPQSPYDGARVGAELA